MCVCGLWARHNSSIVVLHSKPQPCKAGTCAASVKFLCTTDSCLTLDIVWKIKTDSWHCYDFISTEICGLFGHKQQLPTLTKPAFVCETLLNVRVDYLWRGLHFMLCHAGLIWIPQRTACQGRGVCGQRAYYTLVWDETSFSLWQVVNWGTWVWPHPYTTTKTAF